MAVIGVKLGEGKVHFMPYPVSLHGSTDAAVQVGVAAVAAVVSVHRVIAGADLPRRAFEQRVHRCQGHDVRQFEALQPALVSLVVMPQAERQ